MPSAASHPSSYCTYDHFCRHEKSVVSAVCYAVLTLNFWVRPLCSMLTKGFYLLTLPLAFYSHLSFLSWRWTNMSSGCPVTKLFNILSHVSHDTYDIWNLHVSCTL